jgi:hypothetical protein
MNINKILVIVASSFVKRVPGFQFFFFELYQHKFTLWTFRNKPVKCDIAISTRVRILLEHYHLPKEHYIKIWYFPIQLLIQKVYIILIPNME